MFRHYFGDAQQQALGFLISQTSHIETEVYRIRYPDIQYPKLVPIDTSANEWAKSVTFFSMDMFGRAGWFHHTAKDMPIADVDRQKHEKGIEMAGIGYRYTLEELGQAMMIPGNNLSADRAAAARRAYEEFLDNIVLRGDSEKGWTGLINDASVTSSVSPAGAAGNNNWASKTADEILKDVNDLISGMYQASLTVELADTVLLPVAAHNLIATKRVPDTQITVLEFLTRYNVYTSQTGQALTILSVRGLEDVGAGASGRMIAYRRDPQVLKMHLPMPHRFLPVWQTGPIIYDVPGIFRTGGLEIRRPGAVRYMDGIIEGAYE